MATRSREGFLSILLLLSIALAPSALTQKNASADDAEPPVVDSSQLNRDELLQVIKTQRERSQRIRELERRKKIKPDEATEEELEREKQQIDRGHRFQGPPTEGSEPGSSPVNAGETGTL